MSKTKKSSTQVGSSTGSSKKKTSKDSKGSPTSAKKEGSKQTSTKRKKNVTVWGTVGTLSERKRFQAYLEKLTSVRDLIKHGDASIVWLKGLPQRRREAILKRLQEVDESGHKDLVSRIRSYAQRTHQAKRRRTKEMPVEFDPNKDLVGVEMQIAEVPAASKVRFVTAEGIRHVAAICLAAGYKREETAEILGMEIGELNSLVSNEDVKAAVKDVSRAVIQAADQMVLRHLLAGVADDTTNRADLIASRRKKLVLDASAEARNVAKDTDELQRKREAYIKKRFGITQESGDEDNNG